MAGPFWVQMLAFILSIFVLTTSVRMHGAPKSRYFIFLSLAIMLYNLGYLQELSSNDLTSAYRATAVQYIGIVFIAPLIYLFIRHYVNRGIRNRLHVALLFIVPLFSLVTVTGYPYTRLYLRDIAFSTVGAPHLVMTLGPAYYIDNIYGSLLLVCSAVELTLHLPRRTLSERTQLVMFLLAMIVPVLFHAVITSRTSTLPMDFGALAFALAELLLGVYIVRRRKADWLPTARGMVMERLGDPFILLDGEGRLMDANLAAKSLFPEIATLMPGMPDIKLNNYLPVDYWRKNVESEFETTLDGQERYYRISLNPIEVEEDKVCTALIFYDDTESHRLTEQLREMATHDPLTGLQNRVSFAQAAERDIELNLRTGTSAALIMLDIDFFKRVNDKYGHPCGDAVLAAVAQLLRQTLRHTDICGRYGGEEFCLYLPDVQEDDALRLAEMLREKVQTLDFVSSGEAIHITVSLGVAMLHPRDCGLEGLINRADKALYRAKESGRNTVIAAPPPV